MFFNECKDLIQISWNAQFWFDLNFKFGRVAFFTILLLCCCLTVYWSELLFRCLLNTCCNFSSIALIWTVLFCSILVYFTVLVFRYVVLSGALFVFLFWCSILVCCFGVPDWCTVWCTVWCGSFPAVTSPGSNWADCGHNSAPPLLTIIRRSTLRYRYQEGRGGEVGPWWCWATVPMRMI